MSIYDTSIGQCQTTANLAGEAIQCELTVDHSGWAHSSRKHELVWQ